MKKGILTVLVLSLVVGFCFANAQQEQKVQGPIEITWWTNFSGTKGAALETLVQQYNESQSEYHVTAIYQGNANEIIAKLQATSDYSILPDVFMNGSEQTSYFADADFCIPIQQLVDKYGWDYSDTYPFLVSGYSDRDGNLVGYPVGNSFTVVYVNMDMFRAAGIDPYKEVKSVADMARVSKILKDKGIAEYGVGFHKYDGLPQIVLAVQGVDSFNNGNGYDGDVTECLYDTGATHEAMHNYMQALQDMAKDGTLIPYGTDLNSEIIPLFTSGKLAMAEATVSSWGTISKANPSFEVGILATYGADENSRSTGYPVAGTGNFMSNTGDEKRQKGAFEFIKWLSLPENTAYVATQTGYIPVTTTGSATELYQDFVQNKCPAMQYILDCQAKGDAISKFPYLPIANELFDPNRNMIQKVTTDLNSNVDDAIHEACLAINEAISLYNETKI